MTAQPVQAKPPIPQLNGGRMSIASIKSGVELGPLRVMMYGLEGIGKTTFAAAAPGVVFIGKEDGYGLLGPARFPEPQSWNEVLEAVHNLETGPHSHQTLAIDTLDWIEPLCWAQVCTEHSKKSIKDFDYGDGYTAALEKWRSLLASFDRLRSKRGMHIVLLAHSKIAEFRNPEAANYDHYTLAINQKAGGLIRQWCDVALFAQFRTIVERKNGADKGKAIGTPERVIYTEQHASFAAKNRRDLPGVMPLNWEHFAKFALNPRSAQQLVAEVKDLASKVPSAVGAQAVAYAEKYSNDRGRLVEIVNKLTSIAEQQVEQSEQSTTNTSTTTENAQ